MKLHDYIFAFVFYAMLLYVMIGTFQRQHEQIEALRMEIISLHTSTLQGGE